MPGFWVRPEDVREDHLILRGAEAHHLVRVRRHRTGDRVDVVDGEGGYFETRVAAIQDEEVVCRILARREGRGESPVRLCLAPALVKGPRFDFIVEKATEIGVDGILPLLVGRGVVRHGSENKIERWRRLARAAVKQCGRSRLPQILPPATLEQAVALLQGEGRTVLMATPEAGRVGLRPLPVGEASRPLALLVGPEGGFTPEEEKLAGQAGVRRFSWGDRILRADTASIVLAALVLHEAEQAARDR